MFRACRFSVLLLTCATLSSTTPFFLGNSLGKDFTHRARSVPEVERDPRLLVHTEPPLLICPPSLPRIPSLNSTCTHDAECHAHPEHLCCPLGHHRFCLPAVPKKTAADSIKHKPFLGVPRHCPTTTEPLQEFLPVKNCTKDLDCEPRICCPDGRVSYCRTAVPRLEPRTSQTVRVIKNLVSYLQCSPPPPPALDLFPKTCKYSFDCFPNICCQEKGKKVCRPAKRSILRLLASFT